VSELSPTSGDGDGRESKTESPCLKPFIKTRIENKTYSSQLNQNLQAMGVKEKESYSDRCFCIWGLDEKSKSKVWELLQSWLQEKSQSILSLSRVERSKYGRTRFDIVCEGIDANSIFEKICSYSKGWKIFVRENMYYFLRQKSLPKNL